jgi:Rrf2 family iron-sulfur cluster assembly transcriptional regulator
VDTTKCRGAGNCQDGETCLTHYLWEDLSEQIHSFLQGISLADLVTRSDVKRIAESQDRRQMVGSENIELKEVNDLQLPASSV